MANRTRFAGHFNAADYAFGCAIKDAPPALLVDTLNPVAAGTATLTLAFSYTMLSDGTVIFPLNVNAPVNVGSTTNSEKVTPTAVANIPLGAVYDQASFTATTANIHGKGDPVSSATFGLQEAINDAAARGGGIVIVDWNWLAAGGTAAMLAAAVMPTNGSVIIQDNRGVGLQIWQSKPTGAAVTAPSIATTATVGSQVGVVGTWTATTIHVVFTYVTATGGETLPSSDYSFTSTVSLAIGGTGPAAATGVVGYRVYLGTTAWLAPVTAANGTVVQCGAIAAFAIGTSFSVATATTSALATVPIVANAWQVTTAPSFTPQPPFQTVHPPFANVGAISAAAATPMGTVQLPTGFLNVVGRTIRVKGVVSITTNSATGTITINLILYSVYGVTSITPFTVACPSTAMGSAVVDCDFEALMNTTATGATGTLECHGRVFFSLAGTAVGTLAKDFIHAASSTVDLTKQDTLEVSVTTATVAPTAGTLRQLVVEVIQ